MLKDRKVITSPSKDDTSIFLTVVHEKDKAPVVFGETTSKKQAKINHKDAMK